MKVGIATVPPGVFAGTRWTSAGLMLLLWRWARGQRLQIPMRLTGRLLAVAVLMVSMNQVIQLYGLRFITAGLAAVLSSALTPIACSDLRWLSARSARRGASSPPSQWASWVSWSVRTVGIRRHA